MSQSWVASRNRSMKMILLIAFLVLSQAANATQRLTFTSFLQTVKTQNLDLKIEAEKSKAFDAKATGVSIPPPMVGINQMTEDNGNKAQGFEVSQMIPFPSKLFQNRSARNREAASQNELLKARTNELMAKAKVLYFNLWAAQEKVRLFKEKKSVIQNHIKLSRSTARSDSFAAVHVLKSEMDLDLLGNEIEAAEQDLLKERFEVANFLNQDFQTFDFELSEPEESPIPKNEPVESSHQIKASYHLLESLDSKISEAKSSWLPDLTIRYKELGQSSMASRYNEVMVGVTLPFIFFWQPSSEVKKANAEKAQAQYEFEKQKREISSDKSVLLSRAQSLKRQLSNLKDKLIPRAEKRVKIVHNIALRDMETLQDHRDTMVALPELKLKSLELRFEYEEAIANLTKYSSEELK